MATRARELLIRSRALLGRSREAAAQFLATPQPPPRPPRVPVPLPPPVPAADPSGPVPAATEPLVPQTETLAAICANVALRDLNLVDSLLSQLEEMEAKEEDTERLAELYRLDHLATRLRRNAENLRVLAGRDANDSTSDTLSLVDLVRAGMSSIDHYARVTIGRVVALGVVGFAGEDLSRLLAELLDNATKSSPPDAPVRVSAHLTEQGSVLVRIEDEGIGLPADRLSELNKRLSDEPVLDDAAVRHMGLAVVRRLAARHGIRAWLDRRVPHGTTASVLLPAALVSELPEANWSGAQTVFFPPTGEKPARAVPDTPSRPAAGPLPRRTASAEPPVPRAVRHTPSEPVVGGTTSSGLPRRVSQSIKSPNGHAPAGPAKTTGSSAPGTGRKAGHDKLLADLGAFSEGERAAREDQKAQRDGESSPHDTEGQQQ
ncbi:ATP-binding protein [Amycolatopsis cynarae]|uniref:histidine kinase n=1 Tax=Amycolatopsis cynarae TaxID=2995223 RepID=A0ABY7AWY5_9PSEU|nr:ATP-binding protein [Amycolatopsis sp. HUAS 11-8]WAL63143.1 ATP-binding protein [Amycolatopsis sp. HUAS 11-8]